MSNNTRLLLPKKFLKLIHLGLIFGLINFFFILPPRVSAQTQLWQGVCVAGPDNDVATIQGLECLIANIFTVFITLLGLSGFVMFLIAGIRWLTSGSSSKGIESARNTLIFAIVGIIVALSAFIIINLLADFTGINVIRKFQIPDWKTEWQY